MTAEEKKKREVFCCPYCDEEIKAADFPWCRACGVTVICCPRCQKPVSHDDKVCPSCGSKIS